MRPVILGTGIDLVFIPRFEKVAKKWEDRFLDRVFTRAEREFCLRRANPVPSLAARFAAKEAFFKAARIRHLSWKEIEVINDANGRPSFRLSGEASRVHGSHNILLTLSHDGDYAAAQVTIEE